ncbi:MAG: aminopeptidase P family N-terminal domain-containing protein, partial [Pseudomonadota bacterium]
MTERGFPAEEFRARVARAQQRMAAADLEALLLTTEPDVRYFTGFLTRFWESPTRPWFLLGGETSFGHGRSGPSLTIARTRACASSASLSR